MLDTKTKILEAASELFAEGGARALSVRAISGRAGLSTIGIYNHFQGKQGILDALYIEGFEMVMEAIEIERAGRNARDVVLIGLSKYADMANTHWGHYRLIFGKGDPTYTPSEEAKRVGAKAFHKLALLIAPAIPAAVTKRKQREVALQIWALAHGYMSLHNHEATGLIPTAAWKQLMMGAVTEQLDAVMAKYA